MKKNRSVLAGALVIAGVVSTAAIGAFREEGGYAEPVWENAQRQEAVSLTAGKTETGAEEGTAQGDGREEQRTGSGEAGSAEELPGASDRTSEEGAFKEEMMLFEEADTETEARPGQFTEPVQTAAYAENRFTGTAEAVYPNGDRYEGEFLLGKKNGEGTYTYADGSVYAGEWKDDRIHGFGVYVSGSGFSYEGSFADGYKEGEGVYTFADGSVYEGSFAKDTENGYGVYRSCEGWTYEGDFTDGVWNGEGTLTFPDGSSYTGEWKDGRKNGHGKEVYCDSEGALLGSYEGMFRDGKKEGAGSYALPDGTTLSGTWKEDAFLWEK